MSLTHLGLEPNAMAAMYAQQQQQPGHLNDPRRRPDLDPEDGFHTRRGKSAKRKQSIGRGRISNYRRFDTPGAAKRQHYANPLNAGGPAGGNGGYDFNTEGRVSKRPTMNIDPRQQWLEEEQRALKKKLEYGQNPPPALAGERRGNPNILKRGMKMFTPSRSEEQEMKKGGGHFLGRKGFTDPAGLGATDPLYNDFNSNEPEFIPNEGNGIHPFNPSGNRLKPARQREQSHRTPSMKRNNPLKNYPMFGNSPPQPMNTKKNRTEYNSPNVPGINKRGGYGPNPGQNRRRKTSDHRENMRIIQEQNQRNQAKKQGIPVQEEMPGGHHPHGRNPGRQAMFQSMFEFEHPPTTAESRRESFDPTTFFSAKDPGLGNQLMDIRELGKPKQKLNTSNYTADSSNRNPYSRKNNKPIEYESPYKVQHSVQTRDIESSPLSPIPASLTSSSFNPTTTNTAAPSPAKSTANKAFIPSPALPTKTIGASGQYRTAQPSSARRIETSPQTNSRYEAHSKVQTKLPDFDGKQTFISQNTRATHTTSGRALVSTSSTTPNQSINNSLTATIVGNTAGNFRGTTVIGQTINDALLAQGQGQQQFIIQQQPQVQQAFMIDPLLLQRNKDYSYDGKRLSFMERIVNQQYNESSSGFVDYMLDVGHQVTCARDLKRLIPGGIVRPPMEVNLPYLTPNSKFVHLKLMN